MCTTYSRGNSPSKWVLQTFPPALRSNLESLECICATANDATNTTIHWKRLKCLRESEPSLTRCFLDAPRTPAWCVSTPRLEKLGTRGWWDARSLTDCDAQQDEERETDAGLEQIIPEIVVHYYTHMYTHTVSSTHWSAPQQQLHRDQIETGLYHAIHNIGANRNLPPQRTRSSALAANNSASPGDLHSYTNTEKNTI